MSVVTLTVSNVVKETPWDMFDIFFKEAQCNERRQNHQAWTINFHFPHYLEELCFTYKIAQDSEIKLEIKKSQKQ